jgi:hypothetical protein
VYHAARWRFQRERLSGKGLSIAEGEVELTIFWPRRMFCQDLFCSAAESYFSTRPRSEPSQALRGDGIPGLEKRETWGTRGKNELGAVLKSKLHHYQLLRTQ